MATRRDLLRLMLSVPAARALTATPLGRAAMALARWPRSDGEYFVFIHAAGGWDVTLWSDPRHERRGQVEPASTRNTDVAPLRRWRSAPLDGAVSSFTPLRPAGSRLCLGPGIGDLVELHDRLCLINGLAMDTVSHPEGSRYATTGRRRLGATPPARSIDALLADELGARRVGSLVTTLLSEEEAERARRGRPTPSEGLSDGELRRRYPRFDHQARFQRGGALSAAFAVEAMRRDQVRCVSFALGGFDTHDDDYRTQALVQQEAFNLIAALARTLDVTPHPTRPSEPLSAHTHILVTSEFGRAPQINAAGGRDHHPNNSALILSPRFRGDFVFGKSDPEQLLPLPAKRFLDGDRPIRPPDLLATFVHAFGIDPAAHWPDGEVIPELLSG